VNKLGQIKTLLIAAICGVSSIVSNVHAEDNWYYVEVIVFAHLDQASSEEEKWPEDIIMSYPSKLRQLQHPVAISDEIDPNFQSSLTLDLPDFEAQLKAINEPQTGQDILEGETTLLLTDSPLPAEPTNEKTPDPTLEQHPLDPLPVNFQTLAPSELKLSEAMGHLRRIRRYKPLFHESWMQNLTARKDSPGVLITGGDHYGKHRELEGYIKVSVERYLHIETDLWLHEFLPNFGQIKLLQVPDLPSQNESDQEELSFSSQFDEMFKDPYQIKRSFTLRQSRRMRSREVHYLDHPLMGLIVTITPMPLKD